MALVEEAKTDVMYLSIAQGNIVEKVDENTPNAVKREWELKDGTKGSKWKKQYRNLRGYLSEVKFRDSDYGQQCSIKIVNDDDVAVLNVPTDSRYFQDFAQCVRNIKLDEVVTINAYDFTKDGKRRKGLSVKQNGERVENYFWDRVKKENKNGIPEPENRGKGYDKDDWKIFFVQLKKFLVKDVTDWSENGLAEVDLTKKEPKEESLKEKLINKEEPDEEDDLPF